MDLNNEFIEALGSSAPTPGGGGASAYVGALASACASKVGNLTVGKKKYAAYEGEMHYMLEQLEKQRKRLLELVDEDAEAFKPLAASYRMPHDTPEEQAAKHEAEQAALIDAIEVPLQIMNVVEDIIAYTEFAAHNGSRLALSDAGVAAAFARAASDGASLNVYINAKSLDDQEKADEYREKADTITSVVHTRCDLIFDYVKENVS